MQDTSAYMQISDMPTHVCSVYLCVRVRKEVGSSNATERRHSAVWQFDRLLIPNRGAFDLIKVKSRHWPQLGGGGGGVPMLQ